MIFTQQQIDEIRLRLATLGAKDTQFTPVSLPLNGGDIVAVVQQGENKQISINDFYEQLFNGSISYNAEENRIEFLNTLGDVLAYIDTAPFLEDLVKDVYIEPIDRNIVIQYNNENKEDTLISLNYIFNPQNYYTRSETYSKEETYNKTEISQTINTLASDLNGRIKTINDKIPTAASSSNQLADKAYVNDKVATNTATFKGTFNLVTDLGLTLEADDEDIAEKLQEIILDEDNNDYCYIQIPTSEETPLQIQSVERFKYIEDGDNSTWTFEFDLNNSGYTAEEWAAIQSGITSGLVNKLADLPTSQELSAALGNKANASDIASINNQSLLNGGNINVQAVINELNKLDANLVNDENATHKFVTATEKTTWNDKQDSLVSGTNIKTINNTSVLGSGNLTLENSSNKTNDIANNDADTTKYPSCKGVADYVDNIVAEAGVYDVTAKNNNVKFASLSALLSSEQINTLIPTDVRRGGMSVKFVQSSDNKYVQCRFLLSGSFTATQFATASNWQGVDKEPIANSNNLIMSKGVISQNPCFVKISDTAGDYSGQEQLVLSAVKGIRISGIGTIRNYFIRNLTRARSGNYTLLLAYVSSNTVANFLSISIPTEDVVESEGVTPIVFESGTVKVELLVDYNQIATGGILNVYSGPQYAINPKFIEYEGTIKKTITVVSGSDHSSYSDLLYVDIKEGEKFTLFIENITGAITKDIQVYATYKDNVRENIYNGEIDTFVTLTASKDIDRLGTYWSAKRVLAPGTINFCANYNSNFVLSAEKIADTDKKIEEAEWGKVFIKAVSGEPDTSELKMLNAVKDIKLVGAFPKGEMLAISELSRNRNNAYSIAISIVAADGSMSGLCVASIPSSSVTESTPVTQIIFPTKFGDIMLRADFSIFEGFNTINRYGLSARYVIRFDNVIDVFSANFAPCNYYPNNISVYNTDTTLASLRKFTPLTSRIDLKYKGQVTPEKRYMCIGFDDFVPSDFNTIMPLFDKYGFKTSFHHYASTPTINQDIKKYLCNVVSMGHEFGNHTWKHYQFPYTEPMFNGQDPDNPDGNQVPFPSNSQFRDDRGDGKNVFGISLSTKVSSTITMQGPGIETTWGALSDAECQTIREWFSVMKDTNSNLISLLDDLSNKYLGTTGSSNGSWNNSLQEYTGGIFTGCKTSANHEIWERILQLADIYYKEEGGMNFDIKIWSLPGSKASSCFFEHNGKRYYDAEYTKLANYLAKFTSSLTGIERSWVDVLRTYGYSVTHDTMWPGRYDGEGAYCMRRQFVLNSRGRKKDALPYSSNITKNFSMDVIASAYDTTYKNAADMYDSVASPAFKNFIEAARKNMANGIIDLETTDSQNTYSMRLFYEGLLKYCKETGVEIVTKSEAFDICFNHSIENGNLLYNKELRNTAKEFMPTANVPTNPDGYTEGCSVEHESDNTPILSTTAAVTYCHYGIPNGGIKYSADVKGSGTISIYAIKNNSNFDLSELTEIGSVQIDSDDSFVHKDISFNIPNNSMQAYEQVFEGYGNKIIGIKIIYSSGLRVKNMKLVKE